MIRIYANMHIRTHARTKAQISIQIFRILFGWISSIQIVNSVTEYMYKRVQYFSNIDGKIYSNEFYKMRS